jgi:hypothetical protein
MSSAGRFDAANLCAPGNKRIIIDFSLQLIADFETEFSLHVTAETV